MEDKSGEKMGDREGWQEVDITDVEREAKRENEWRRGTATNKVSES